MAGTPRRLLDHLARGTLAQHAVRTIVLDEADEMLDKCLDEQFRNWDLARLALQITSARFATTPSELRRPRW